MNPLARRRAPGAQARSASSWTCSRREPRSGSSPRLRRPGARAGADGGVRDGRERAVHSLHAYFLRAGDPDHPIVYEVDRSRDGAVSRRGAWSRSSTASRSFTCPPRFRSRKTASIGRVPMPEARLARGGARHGDCHRGAEAARRLIGRGRFIAQRGLSNFARRRCRTRRRDIPREPHMKIWFRAVDRAPGRRVLHRCLLAYASDYYLLGAAGMDARLTVDRRNLQMASIDHAMWFHRPRGWTSGSLCARQPDRHRLPRLCAGKNLQPGRPVSGVDGPGGAGPAKAVSGWQLAESGSWRAAYPASHRPVTANRLLSAHIQTIFSAALGRGLESRPMYQYDQIDQRLVRRARRAVSRPDARFLAGQLSEDDFRSLAPAQRPLHPAPRADAARVDSVRPAVEPPGAHVRAHRARVRQAATATSRPGRTSSTTGRSSKPSPTFSKLLASVRDARDPDERQLHPQRHCRSPRRQSRRMRSKIRVHGANTFASGRRCIPSSRTCRASSRSR